MAVIAEVTLRGITREQYDAVRERTGWLERPPEGGLAHLTWWEGEDCHNLDGWASEEAFAAFGEDRLAPAMAALGIDIPPIAVFHPAHEVYTPRAGVVAATGTPDLAAAGHADVARTGYAAYAAGDIPGVLALFTHDLVWTVPDSVPFGGVYHGPQGAADFFSKLPQNFAELNVQPERYIEAGDTVVVPGRHRGRTQAGKAFDVPFVHVWTLRNGKVSAFTEVMDSAPVVQALAPDAEAILRRMFDEIINQGRFEIADELFAEDYVDHGPMGDLSGRETFKQLVAQWRDAVPDVHCEISSVVADGDLCAWVVRTTGTHTGGGLGFPATGKRFETLSANIGRFRDGRAAEHWSEQGLFPMLVQVGVIGVPVPAAG